MTRTKIQWTSAPLWFAALLSAALVVVAYAPHHIWPLAFFALVPLTVSLRHSGAKERFFFGWMSGTFTTLGGFYWIPALIVNFGELPAVVGVAAYVALALQQGLVAGFAFAATKWMERGFNLSTVWSLPVAFVAAEAAIPLIFPWRLGYTQYLNPLFIQSADLGGPFLVTGLVVVVNSVLASIICRRFYANEEAGADPQKPFICRNELIAIGLVVLNIGYGAMRLHQTNEREASAVTTTIGLVEADIPIEEKWDTSLYERNIYRHQRPSQRLVEQGAELIVWPESSLELSYYLHTSSNVDSLTEARAASELSSYIDYDVSWFPISASPLPDSEPGREHSRDTDFSRFVPQRGFSAPLLTGTTLTRFLTDAEGAALPPRGAYPRRTLSYNSSLLLGADGQVEGTAHKVVRMPISEFVPFAAELYDATGVNLYNIIPSAGLFGAADGPQAVTLPGEHPLKIGILNCYEDLMPNFVREMVLEDESRPDVLINLTNDAWFGRSAEPIQHFALSTFRAIEARTWLVRATNTGVSAFVDSAGRIVSKTGVYDAETLMAEVPHLRAQKTLFARLGSWPAYLAWIATALGLLQFIRLRRRERTERSI